MNRKNKTCVPPSARLRAARTQPPNASNRAFANNSTKENSAPLTVEQMLAVNERTLRTRGRASYSKRALIAARKLENSSGFSGAAAAQPALALATVRVEAATWKRNAELSGFSDRTLEERERVFDALFWFAERESYERIGQSELEAYLHHVRDGHLEPDGRFGKGPLHARAFKPTRPATRLYHYSALAALWNYFISERHLLARSPFINIPKPAVPEDSDVLPFVASEIAALLEATKQSIVPARDKAIFLMLLDTGLRASELSEIKRTDLDERQNALVVRGKGNKKRVVYFGQKCAKALWAHLSEQGEIRGFPVSENAPLFASEVGLRAGRGAHAARPSDVV